MGDRDFHDKIELDKDTLKALSSDTKIEILKKLDVRRMTVSELSRELGINKSAIHKHLDRMADTGLVVKRENTNKFVYYELTNKGTGVLHPDAKFRIIVLLTSATVAFVGGIWGIYRYVKEISRPSPPGKYFGGASKIEILIFGIILIIIALYLLYYAFKVRKSRAALSNVGRQPD